MLANRCKGPRSVACLPCRSPQILMAMVKRLSALFTGVALLIGLAGWTSLAGAQLFSSTGPVIAIFDGRLLVGEATGHLGGWGTIAVHSAALTCVGEFSATEALGDGGELRCRDGGRAAFLFQRLSLRRGYGAGRSGASALPF